MFSRARIPVVAVGAALAAVGVGAGLALATAAPASAPSAQASSAASASPAAPAWLTSYSGYSAMMDRYGRTSGMMGGAGATGGMMNGAGSTDMGRIMGRVLAQQPGPRISAAQAAAEAAATPAGAVVNAAAGTVTFTTSQVVLTVVAGPTDAAMYEFEVAGLIDPAVVVPAGARITLRLINADTDMAHGIVITGDDWAAGGTWMPMADDRPAFPGADVWALGEQTTAGAPTGTARFTASAAGTYTYLCPIPGHAGLGMRGTFTVR